MDFISSPPIEAVALWWSLEVQLFIQLSKLLQEPRIWWDVPVGADSFNGIHQRHVLVDHQVGQDQGGRAAETHCTVDEHFTCRLAGREKTQIEELSHPLPAPCLYLQPCDNWIIVVNFILTV